MLFSIYARWGEKVFETKDKKIGWDGRYKGQLLPMDAFAYTLDVEFVDGKKFVKKGDITLIRLKPPPRLPWRGDLSTAQAYGRDEKITDTSQSKGCA